MPELYSQSWLITFTNPNTTETLQHVPSQPYWIATLLTDCCIIICNTWITIAFVSHSRNVLDRHRIDVHNRRVYKSLIFAVTVPFARYFSTIALLMVMINPSDLACEVAIDVGKSFFVVSVVAIYIFYWIRQRSFYQNAALLGTVNRKIRTASKFSLFQLLSMAFIMIPLTVYPDEYEANAGGCISQGGHSVKNWRYYVYAIFLLVAQTIVLSLFLHPLVCHYKAQKRLKKLSKIVNTPSEVRMVVPDIRRATLISSEVITAEQDDIECGNLEDDKQYHESYVAPERKTTGTTNRTSPDAAFPGVEQENPSAVTTTVHGCGATTVRPVLQIRHTVRGLPTALLKRLSSTDNRDKLYRIIRRTFKLSALAVCSDMVTLLVAGDLLPEDTPQCVVRVVYDVDLFINVLAVIAGFEDWKKILKRPAVLLTSKNQER